MLLGPHVSVISSAPASLSPSGVLGARPAGVSAVGFEGVEMDVPVLESVAGAVPRARGISATGQGLAPVLEQGGRAPKPGVSSLKNAHGGPDRIAALSRRLAVATRSKLGASAVEVDVTPIQEVSAEALRMLDAYLNRTDELHPMSRELLARAFTDLDEPMPEPGEKVPMVDLPPVPDGPRDRVMARLRAAAEGSGASQVAFFAERQATAERLSSGLGWEDVRGVLIDQRT